MPKIDMTMSAKVKLYHPVGFSGSTETLTCDCIAVLKRGHSQTLFGCVQSSSGLSETSLLQ